MRFLLAAPVALAFACDTSEPLYSIDPPRPRPDPAPLFAPSTCPDVAYRELETTAWVLAEASNGALFIGAMPVTSDLTTSIERSFPAPAGAIDLAALADDTLAVLTLDEIVVVDSSEGDGAPLYSLGVSEGAFTIGFDGTHVVLGRDNDVTLISLESGARMSRSIAHELLPEFDGDTDRPFPPRLPSEQAPVLREVVPLVDTQLLLMETDGVPEPIVPPFDGIIVSSNAPSRSSAFALLGRDNGAPDFVTTFLVHPLDVEGTDSQLKDVDTAGSDGCHVVIIERFVIDGSRYQTLSFHRPDRVRYVVDGTGSWTRETDGTVSYAEVPFQPRILAATGAWLP